MRKRSNHIYLFLFLCILVGFVFFGVHLVSLFATMCIILNPLLQCFREPSLKEWCSRPSSRIFKIIRRLLCWPLAFMCSSFYIAFMCAVCSGSLEREREQTLQHFQNYFHTAYGSVQEIFVGHEPRTTNGRFVINI